jgi:peptide/nickel transport system substrate-binding protein
MTQPDAERFMDQYLTTEVSNKANKWQGRNIARWRNENYDKLFHAAEVELDPVKRAALFIQMNDMVVKDNVIIPLISRPRVRGANLKLVAQLSGWDLDFSGLPHWYKES